ncbi:MAG: peptide chain release factor N(5)-glutamine methyltransferase [Bacteroidales bacterium]|nr:peptide chain release factor N(5)-glutamine methyltransferase [Bacteroidales bacterium]
MKSFIESAHQQLSILYPEHEVRSMISYLLQSVTGFSKAEIILRKNSELSPENNKQLNTKLKQLASGEPLQYVLGETEFYNLKFKVNQSVLIPRPETEELVDLILRENNSKQLRILDIGTGSGCIAISLAKKLPDSVVEAWDISEDALQVALENSIKNKVDVHFSRKDILNLENSSNIFDIIVSNPPYVCESEAEAMHQNVLRFEPHLALFVPNHDPLMFYSKIVSLSSQLLRKGGLLYFEINAAYGSQTADLLRNNGYQSVVILKDIFGKERFVKGVKGM